RLGVQPGDRVAVVLRNGADAAVAIYGILRAGAAFVPLDPGHPAPRVAAVLADAEAAVAVTSAGHAGRVGTVDAVLVDDLAAAPAPPMPAVDPDALAYVIFTSGSTGRPKGVQVTHRGLVNHVAWAAAELAGRGAGGSALFSSVAFDLVVPNVWAPLVAGQRVFAVGQDADLADLGSALVAAGPFSFLKLTPGHLEILGGQLTDAEASALAGVVVAAGEALPGVLADRWLALLGPDGLINEYGPTEATVGSTVHPVRVPHGGDVVPIGTALPGMSTYVLDPAMRPSPIGVPGELYVGGTGVARGYAGRPDLTADRFVPDPYGPPGSRLYRTGDRARRRADGAVDFLGRADEQVKIRGYRVEPAEIEAVLLTHPGVRDAVVVVDRTGDPRLVACYVADADLDGLAGHCAAALPEHLVPAAVVRVDAVPLTANGKADRAALAALVAGTAAVADRPFAAPATPLEAELAGIWGAVLGLDRVGATDSFFDIGGHSISAIALVGALRRAGHPASVRDVFEHRTVAALAAVLAGRAEPAPEVTAVAPFALLPEADRALLPVGVVDAYPISQVQLGMLVKIMTDERDRTYHNVSAFRIRDEEPFSVDALREAVRVVVRRHDILRTSFALSGFSTPVQLVHGAVDVDVRHLDLRAEADPAAVRRAFVAAERAELFELHEAPHLRIAGLADDGCWWFVLTMSHGILEGWSHHSLLMEVLDCYRSLRDTGEPAPFEAPAVRYADFVAGELEALASAEDVAYWTSVVRDHPRLDLPAWGTGRGAGPGSADAADRGVRVAADVPFHDLRAGLRAAAAAADVPLKSVLLAAHLTVLSRLTAHRSFTAGLVCHGRPEAAGADRVYGMHLNTLPFVHRAATGTWRELVRDVFRREVELWPHRRYPLPEVQRLAGGERPVDTLFNYLDFEQVDTGLVDTGTAVYDAATEFGLHVSSLDGNLSLLSYSSVMGQGDVLRLADAYRAVLEAIVADLDGDATAPVFGADELATVLADDAVAAAERGGPVDTVPELVLDRIAAVPDAEAVNGVTYAGLDARSAAVAAALAARGAGAGDVVGVLLDRGADLVAALLGVWRAGAAYVPLDPSYPAARIAGMLADAGAGVTVTSACYADRFVGAGTVLVDSLVAAAAPPMPAVDPDALAYVIFTSGSTGRPKGVQVTHRGLANHVEWAAAELAGRGDGGCALFSSVAFDLVVPNVWAPLITGQRVFAVGQDADLADLGRTLAAAGPFSFLKLTPGHLEILGHQLTDAETSALAGVVVAAGEALPGPMADRWLGLLGPGRLVNEYGPTETTVGACVHPVTGPQDRPVVPIGRALPGVRMYVLDGRARLTAVGVEGELYVGGTGVARGYAGRPDLTADRFVPDPYGPPGSRLYRTGDRARRLPDGAVEFLGRADEQVKLRGYRVELAEIEAVLADAPGVRDAVVVAREDDGEKRLVCFHVSEHAPDLAAHCAERLPEFMVPAVFVRLDAVPLNANGKVDRAALLAVEISAERDRVAPSTPTQERIAATWALVLRTDRVGVTDRFFDVGGDSLRAVAFVGALRRAGITIGVRDVFERQTIAALAELVDGAEPAEAAPEVTSVAPFALVAEADRAALPAGLADAYPASQAQIGMAVEIQKRAHAAPYHVVRTFRVRDTAAFSLDALRAAVADVVARHDTLRTTFDLSGRSVPMQLVHARVEVPVTEHTGPVDPDAVVAAERARPFEVEQPAPLLRVSAHRDEADGGAWWLTVAISHLITGGWDLNTLLVELLDHYDQRRRGLTPPQAGPAAVRYADFVAAELASLDSEDDRGYWRDITARYAKLVPPDGWGDPADTPRTTHRVRVDYRDLDAGLRALATACQVSPKAVLHAAHLTVMGGLGAARRFYTGLVCDARPEADGAHRVHGMYINTLPFAHERGARTWRELVARVFAREVELWPHRRFPLPAVRRLADAGPHPVEVVFDYTEYRQVDADVVDVDASSGEGWTEFSLQVGTAGGHVHLAADSHVFGAAALRRLAAMYRAVLEAMVADPAGDALVVPHAPGEAELVLPAATPPVATGLVHEAFTAAVAADPAAVAVTAGGRHLTYGELDAAANRLAHHLRALGVGRSVPVGVCAPRSVEQITAVV
ncbi:MAG TPA: amino acid adenylation domain-containing protein, partial [Pseudonocardiaceae bacterium]